MMQAFLRLRRRPGHDRIPDFSEYVGCPPRPRLSEAEFAARYGASDDDIAALKAHYAQLGLQLDHHGARRHLYLSGPVSAFNAAFVVTLHEYEKQHGRQRMRFRSHAEPPQVPDHLAHIILGVHELENEPKYLPAVSPLPAVFPFISAATLASIYKFPVGYSAAGQVIAIYIPSINAQPILNSTSADLISTCAAAGVSVPTTSWVSDDPNVTPNLSYNFAQGVTAITAENWLDVSMVAMFAPGAQIVNYLATGFASFAARLAHPNQGDPTFTVGSISYGGTENVGASVSWTNTDIFEDCAIQGVTIVNASGDFGVIGISSPISASDIYYARSPTPTNDPYILGVGGTIIGANSGTLSASNFVEWEYAPGPSASDQTNLGSGGGVSVVVPRPAYQNGVTIPATLNPLTGAGTLNGAAGRGTPDISALFDGRIAYFQNGNGTTLGGGTSQSCPIVASLLACCNHALGRNVGFVNPTLYAAATNSSVIRHLSSGGPVDNSAYVSFGGTVHKFPGYPVSLTGWSAGVGLGVINGQGLVSIIQAQSTVTITGVQCTNLLLGCAKNQTVPAGTAIGTMSATATGGLFQFGFVVEDRPTDLSNFYVGGSTLTAEKPLSGGLHPVSLIAIQSGAVGSPFSQAATVEVHQIAASPLSIAPVNHTFTLSGNLTGYATPPTTLQYQDNGGSWVAFPGGSTVSAGNYQFLHPAVAAAQANYSVAVRDSATPAAVDTVTFNVAAAGVTISNIGTQNAGVAFTVIGSLLNQGNFVPTLQYRDNNGAYVALPGGSTVLSNSYFFTHPGLSAGSYTVGVQISDGSASATSNSFSVVANVGTWFSKLLITDPWVSAGSTSPLSATFTGLATGSAALTVINKGSAATITMNNGHLLSITSDGRIQDNGVDIPGGSGSAACSYDPAIDRIYGLDDSGTGWYYYAGAGSWINIADPTLGGGGTSYDFQVQPFNIAGDGPNTTITRTTSGSVAAAPAFADDFTSLALYNYNSPAAGSVWQPASWFGAGRDGENNAGTWIVNPFVQPIQNYTISGGILSMRLAVTPPANLAACGNCATVGGQLQTNPTFQGGPFGYWEISCAVPAVPGSQFGFAVYDSSGQQELDLAIATAQNGFQFAKLNVWTTSPSKVLNNFFFSYNMASPIDPRQFHTYGIDLQAATTTMYIDRVSVMSFTTPQSYVNPMFWVLGYSNAQDEGGGLPAAGNLPSFAQIDYVSTWTNRPF